jgi:hypothetical protein
VLARVRRWPKKAAPGAPADEAAGAVVAGRRGPSRLKSPSPAKDHEEDAPGERV